jgi:putative transposase
MGKLLHALKRPSSTRVLNALRTVRPELSEKLLRTDSKGVTRPRLWEAGGGYDRNLNQRKSSAASMTYIHENPVRRGLCGLPEQYLWSSASAFCGAPSPVVLTQLS